MTACQCHRCCQRRARAWAVLALAVVVVFAVALTVGVTSR